MKRLLWLYVFVGLVVKGFAEPSAPLTDFVSDQLDDTIIALDSVAPSDPGGIDGSFAMKEFSITVEASVGFSAGIANVSVSPDITLSFKPANNSRPNS